jgi:hypothetical protein
MIRIAAEHIYVLRNSTGKPFTDLLDRLIRSYAWTLGIPPSAVLDNPRTNHPDGGVDTQVTVGAPDPWGYFNGTSTWQYKAVELKDLTDSKVKEEISGDSKDYVRSLLHEGYAYRMCIAHDGPAERKAEIKALLDAEIEKVNPAAPKSIVLFASEVVAWVNTFPAIAAEILGSPMTDFFHFATWLNRERASPPHSTIAAGSASALQDVRSANPQSAGKSSSCREEYQTARLPSPVLPSLTQERLTLAASISSSHAGLPKGHAIYTANKHTHTCARW